MFRHDAFKAVETENLKSLRSILTKKPATIHKLKNGDTLLHAAAQVGSSGGMEVLLQYGANVNRQNSAGRTALHISCALGDYNGVVVLCERDADPSAKCPSGNTPLHEAVRKGNMRIIKYLFNYSINIDVQNRDGWSALHTAVSCNRIDAAECLLHEGIDIEALNKKGLRAYEMALDLMHHDMAELISKFQKKPSINTSVTTQNETHVAMVSKIGNLFQAGKEIFYRKTQESTANQGSTVGGRETDDKNDHENMFEITQKNFQRLISKQKETREVVSSDSERTSDRDTSNIAPVPLSTEVFTPATERNIENKQSKERNEQSSSRFNTIRSSFKFLSNKETSINNTNEDISENIKKIDDNGEMEETEREDEEIHECPVCFEIPLPPVHIYQCSNGHLYCGTCKDMPNMFNCPQCGIDIASCRTRNRYAEEIIDRLYGSKTKKN